MLTIYRASAGTGKTHALTGEYLKMLFAGTDVYPRILSVTFTNKATEEMKSRIIEELHRLSSGKASDYLGLLQSPARDEAQIRAQARTVLIHILHDYSRFHVSTIDHFFQQTMRSFIREIGLQGNYRIEMDKDLVLSEAIDNLLADLDKRENARLLEWLLRFSEDKINNGENWDLRTEIKLLGNELFKETYKAYSHRIRKDIEDKEALSDYRNELQAIITATETRAKALGKEGLAVMSEFHLSPSDFKGGSNSALYFFERLSKFSKNVMDGPSATFRNMAGCVEACYAKSAPADRQEVIRRAFSGGLDDCIRRTVDFFDHLTAYRTAREIVRYYYTLGILTDIAAQIGLWRETHNRMLIADTTELLNKVIDDSEVSFIYEKTGTRIDHYMVDEFQDTSEMQWRNFRPLIGESLANGNANLIVGDVKQSIYRFRNSDWTLLDEQVQRDFPADRIVEKTLTTNWRSLRNIVAFNNAFFEAAPGLLQDMYNRGLYESALPPERHRAYESKIISAYSRCSQEIARSGEGHVRIEFLPDTEECSWKEESMKRVIPLIERLQQNGYALRDIAILVRTRAEGVSVAETLLSYKDAHPESAYRYDIISEDALIISHSSAVNFMVSMLRYLNRPDEPSAFPFAQMAYAMMRRNACPEKADEGFQQALKHGFLSAALLSELGALSNRSLYEVAEGIYRLFEADFPANEQVFVMAFLDLVAGCVEKEPTDMEKFLSWWDETGKQSKITTPDSQNAIRILTIHKSKGLGFKVVILPFCDWEADQKSGSVIWCHPEEKPFNHLQLVPVGYSEKLSRTHFAEEYYHEKLHAYIDNLNALYVALTRAKEELFLFVPDGKEMRTKPISGLIRECVCADPSDGACGEEARRRLLAGYHAEEAMFEWGTWGHPLSDERQREAEEVPVRQIPSVCPDERIHLRLHRKGGHLDDKQRRYGILMHDLLSQIRTKADIPKAVEAKENDGEINHREAEELIVRLEKLSDKPEVRQWFDDSMTILNEVEILFGDGRSRRPDRVMMKDGQTIVVDYKFGEQKDNRHQQQIKKYCSLIREMGCRDVKGYLWYVESDEIMEV
ncbi:MAG: UvrD-helicase domain-containing protein [Tannerella sp.]|jgi:ATP-dependent exoDNAse (exonuclease V) beta subunit|nr:UvrD-helicase domain-containing protein [Tannerella sp.]